MRTVLPPQLITGLAARFGDQNQGIPDARAGAAWTQPVHVVYGGAHLFHSDTAQRLGAIALRTLQEYAPDAKTFGAVVGIGDSFAEMVYTRVMEKLGREPVEDFRLDFEDGYGNRPDAEEDGHAESSAIEVARGMAAEHLPRHIGIRIKPLNAELHKRSIRTLDIFVSTLAEKTSSSLPAGFVVTLPKVASAGQVEALVTIFEELEAVLGLGPSALRMELMIETPQSILNERGECALPQLVEAARGRCRGAHFGPYDYTASLGITAAYQHLRHPACDFAREVMQVALAETRVWLSDGPTNILPVALHRVAKDGPALSTAQINENHSTIHRAWKLHFDDVQHSLANGFYQGWDLHPAQLITRYAALYEFFLSGLEAASERLHNFIQKAAQATLVGEVFDDAATGQGLLNYFLRAIRAGAVTEQEAQQRTGLTLQELRGGSFSKIAENRRA
jgi:citrate lyase beta subunit